MNKRIRLALSQSALLLSSAIGAWSAAAQTPPPETPCSKSPGNPRIPRDALIKSISGTVRVQVVLEDGRPVEATILSGPKVYHDSVRQYMMTAEHVCPSLKGQGREVIVRDFEFWIDESPPPRQPLVASAEERRLAGPVLGAIEMGKSYAELSPPDRAAVRSLFAALPDDVDPPYPVGGPVAIYRHIDGLRQRARPPQDGLAMDLVVDPTGEIERVEIVGAVDPDLARALASFMMREQRFSPARCAGQPCTMKFPLRARFAAGDATTAEAAATPPAAPRP